MSDFDIASYVSHIEANRSIKDALMQSLKTRRPPYRISVTDLLNLKQAYFRRTYPEIVPPLEKQQLMWAGTGFHKTFGSAVSSEEYLEQFVEAEGIVGKIDIYEKIPVEVKTTSTPVDTKDLLKNRPTYIEQLGMYCAMVNAHEGEIIVYQRPEEESPSTSPLVVYHVTFPDLEAIREEMRRRRDLLVQALIDNDPSNLPICPWFNKHCDYSQVCDCTTTSVPASHEIADLAGEIYVDNMTCEQLLSKMAGAQPSQVFGINDIVFPRKAYFERLKLQEIASGKEVREEKEGYLRSMDERGFIDALRDSLYFGAPGEAQKIPVKHASLSDLVRTWQNMPTILRDPKFSSLVERERLPRTFSHYFLRLGFDCAMTENTKGRLLLYYVRVPKENAKLMVYDVSFRNLNAVKAEALRRLELLEKATSPLQLPKCPSWMCSYCDYKLECGEA
ncbi:MAG: PD-(D/E)XK nuclease family protein [Dehalococcoidia bacterium]|nr:PD-(D/E)XK nuclease family protein [Dehalococcoidia bacterium]